MQFQKEFEPIMSYFNKNKVFLPGMSQQLILIREANKVLDKQITLLLQQYTMRSNISWWSILILMCFHFHLLSFSRVFVFQFSFIWSNLCTFSWTSHENADEVSFRKYFFQKIFLSIVKQAVAYFNRKCKHQTRIWVL